MKTSKKRLNIWVNGSLATIISIGLSGSMNLGFAETRSKNNSGGPELPPTSLPPSTQNQAAQSTEPSALQKMVQQRDQLLQQIQQIQQDDSMSQYDRERKLAIKQGEFSKVQEKVTYRLKGETRRLNRAEKKDAKIQDYLSHIDKKNDEINTIMAQLDEHWANTAPVVDERPGMPSFAKRMNLPKSNTGGKGPEQNAGQNPTQASTQVNPEAQKNTGSGTMSKQQLAAAYSKIMQKNSEIKAIEVKIKNRAKEYKRLTGEYHPVVDPKTGRYDPNTRKPTQLEPATSSNKVTVAPNGPGQDGKKPIDPTLAKNPNCWVATPDPIAELIPNVVFETGKSDITEEQANEFMEQLKLLQTKLKAAGHEKLGRIEAISSASFIPRRKAGGNEALAADRGTSINSTFRAGLNLEPSLNELIAPNFSTGLDESVEKEQGPQWDPNDKVTKKGKKPSEEQIRAKAEELMADPNAPFSKSNIETAVSELKKCCSKDQFDLKYRPHQYAKIKIYGSIYAPENPECVRTAGSSPTVSDSQVRPNDSSSNPVSSPSNAQPISVQPANTSGTLRDE
jgi:hypothetical protein